MLSLRPRKRPRTRGARLIASTLIAEVLLAPLVASAQPAPTAPTATAQPPRAPTPGYGAPLYGPPPGWGWYPPPIAVPGASPTDWGRPTMQDPPPAAPPEPETKLNDPRMVIGGSVLVSLGAIWMIGAAGFFSAASKATTTPACLDCDVAPQPDGGGFLAGGITMLALAVVAEAAGIPMVVIGARRVPEEGAPKAALRLVPSAGAGGLVWRF